MPRYAGHRRFWLGITLGVVMFGALLVGVFVLPDHEASSSPAPAYWMLNPCQYFTLDDARPILGPAATVMSPGGGVCAFLSGNPATVENPILVSISAFAGHPPSVAQSYEGGPPTHVSALTGLGDRARWYSFGRGAAGVLEVRVGSRVVRLMVGDRPNQEAIAIAAASVIAPRLVA